MKSTMPETHSEPGTISDPHRLLTVTEAAAFIGRTKGWLDKARCYGSGPPFYRIGRRILYSRAELRTWLSAHRYESTSAYAETDPQ